jgi:TRAP-type C4-dicarboxylate transport system permease small subunit
MKALHLVADWTDKISGSLAMASLFGLVAVTAIDVGGRTFFDAPLGYAYELAGVLLGIAVYSGLVGVNWRRDHVKIDLLEGTFMRLPGFDLWRDRFSWVLEMVFFIILGIMVLRQAGSVARFNERFFFLPMEKWVPMTIYFVLIAFSVVILAVAVSRRSATAVLETETVTR